MLWKLKRSNCASIALVDSHFFVPVYFQLWSSCFLQRLSVVLGPYIFLQSSKSSWILASSINRNIELWELQRFLWTQYGSRLSDEFFDYITDCRQLCDPLDGTLAPAAFLDFTDRLLSRSSAARGLAIRESRMWPMPLAGIRGMTVSERSKNVEEDADNYSDNQSEVHSFIPKSTEISKPS